ncbi:unnamed protein product, partial [Prorocentrum cordatum]
FHLVRYNVGGPAIDHERLTLLPGYILAPDGDDYAELAVPNHDIRSIHILSGQGEGLPGIPPQHRYQFRQLPRAAEVWAALRRASAQGFGATPASPFCIDLSATNVLGLAAGPLPLPDPAAVGPGAGAGALAPAGGAAAAPPAFGGPAAAGPPAGAGGVGALAAALGGGGAGVPAAAAPVPGGAPAAAAPPLVGDPRVMALVLDGRGVRDIALSDAVKLQTETARADWPVKGLRTLLWVLGFMLRMAGGAMAWHNRWIAMMQLGESDESVKLHETLCRVIETALCYDQLVICELASYEYLARQLQLVEGRAFEERVRKTQPVPKAKAQAKELAAADFGSEVGHFLGTGETKGNLCICPALMDWIADQMKRGLTSPFPSLVSLARFAPRPSCPRLVWARPCAVPIASATFFRYLFFLWMGAAIYHWVALFVCALPKVRAGASGCLGGLPLEPASAAYSERSSACEASLVEMLAQAPGYAGDSGRVRPYSQPLVAWLKSTKAASTSDVVSDADSIALQGWRQTMLNPESVAAELRDALGIQRPCVDPELRYQPKSHAQFLKQLEAHDMISWRAASLPVLEFSEAVSKGVFTGLQIDGLSGVVRVRPDRLARTRQAVLGLLRRGRDSAGALSVLVGHCTWGMILRRDVLAIFNSVYRFINVAGAHPAPLWDSVVRELRAAVALIPLWSASTRSRWSSRVHAPDASTYGKGACVKVIPPDLVSDVGRVAEKWRCHQGSSVLARAHAFSPAEPHQEVIRTARSRETHTGPSSLSRGSLSAPGASAVSASTGRYYHDRAQKFLSWCLWTALDASCSVDLGTVLAVHVVHLFLCEYDHATGRAKLAALKCQLPLMLVGSRPMPRAVRALQGGAQFALPLIRHQLPRMAMFATVGVLLAQGRLSEVEFARLAFDTCLRPRGAHRLAASSFLAPRVGSKEGYQLWASLVNEAASGRPGQTGVTDVNVIVNDPSRPLSPALVFFGGQVGARLLQLMEVTARTGTPPLRPPPLVPASAPAAESGARCRRLGAPLKGVNRDDTDLRAIRVANALAESVFKLIRECTARQVATAGTDMIV